MLPCLALVLPLLIAPDFAAGKAAADKDKADKDKAAAPVAEHKLSEWQIGAVLFGDAHSAADMSGKVVVIENWGVHCAPCVALLPHMADLDKHFRDKGLCIIGAESQGSSKEAIKPLLDNAKVKYTITAGASGPMQGNSIPRCAVFDPQGLLVYNGYPAGPGFDKAIKDSLRKVKGADADEAKAGGSSIAKAGGAKEAKPGAATDGKAAAATEPPASAVATLIPMRAWTNSDGREIRAAVTKIDSSNVTFLMPNNKEVVYPLDKLSEGSRITLISATQGK